MTRRHSAPMEPGEFACALEAATKALGQDIARELPDGAGFALFVFDYGEHGSLAYCSNASRADMIATVREWLDIVERQS